MTETVPVEIVEAPNPPVRFRDRNSARSERASVAVLPPPVDAKVNALRTLDGESQARAVTAMLSHARTGLLAAIAAQDLPQIVEYKAKTAAIQEIAKQLRLGKEIQLDAAEFVRRAERGLGVAIREGQANGTIETKAEGAARGPAVRDGLVSYETIKPKPTDFAGAHELSNTHGGIYNLTDGIGDGQFEDVLAVARREGNLSRSNVARKCKAMSKSSAPNPETGHAPVPLAKPNRGPKANSTEMIENVNGMLEAIVQTLRYVDVSTVDPDKRGRLLNGIRQSMNRIRKHLKEIENG